MTKNTEKMAKELKDALTEDILERYNHPEYWDPNIIDACLEKTSEADSDLILKILKINNY